MLTVYGAKDVSVLNGGFHKWREEGRETETGEGHEPECENDDSWTFDDSIRPISTISIK